jgi:serine phosphatase RsbU (regulator of sigma subunit)
VSSDTTQTGGRRRRLLVLALTGTILVGSVSGLTLAGMSWHRIGWSGLAYGTAVEDILPPRAPLRDHLAASSRKIIMVATGSPADRAGIRTGDRVLSINGIDIADLGAVRALADRVSTGSTIVYRLERDGTTLTVPIELQSPLRSASTLVAVSASVLTGLVFLAISVLVAWSRPASTRALVFYLLCTCGALLFLGLAVVELELPDPRGIEPLGTSAEALPLMLGYGVLALVLQNLLLHLVLIFPTRRPVLERWPEAVHWVYAASLTPVLAALLLPTVAILSGVPALGGIAGVGSAVGLTIVLVSLLRSIRRFGVWPTLRATPFRLGAALLLVSVGLAPLLRGLSGPFVVAVGAAGFILTAGFYLLTATVWTVLTLITLYRSYREVDLEGRRQLRWPLWGIAVALGGSLLLAAGVLLAALLVPAYQGYHSVVQTIVVTASKLVYVLIPLSFAFAILKYRLMDIDVIIRRTVVYAALTAVLAAGYFLLVGVFGVVLVSFSGVDSTIVAVAATLVVAVALVPVRRGLQRALDRRFPIRRGDVDTARQRLVDVVVHASSLGEAAHALAEVVQETVRSRTAVVMVRHPISDTLRPAAAIGVAEERIAAFQLPVSHPLLTEAPSVRQLDRSLADELALSGRVVGAEHLAVARSAAGVVGALLIGRPLDGAPLEDDELGLLDAAAGQLAVAVGSLQERRQEIESTQAHAIQRSLLPPTLPKLPGLDLAAIWLPAREVSGDYYDVVELDDDTIALCIADVVGKGMPAALLMSGLQAAVRALAAPDRGAAATCREVRRVMIRNLVGGTFVTFFYAVLDRRTSTLTFANCGHNQPIVVRDDGTFERLVSGGPAIARMLATSEITEDVIELRAGDSVVLFTDGVSEATDASGEQLGEDTLEEILRDNQGNAAAPLLESVVAAVRAHTGGAFQDDVTLVVAAIEDRPAATSPV